MSNENRKCKNHVMRLRNLVPEDESLLKDLEQRPETAQFIGSLRNLHNEQHVKVIETNGRLCAGIVAVIKSVAMDGKDHELLCVLLADHERKGLATRACREMLNEVLDDPSVHRVIGCVDRENKSSRALIERLDGTFLQQREGIDSGQDIYVFK